MTPTPAPTRLAVAVAIATSALGSTAVQAFDTRAIALGGSIVAAGEGVPGAWANPAALMSMQRAGQKTHLSLGFGVDVRDDVGIVDLVDDNEDLASDIEDEVDRIDASDIECPLEPVFEEGNPIPIAFDVDRDTPCLDDLEGLSALSAQAIEVFDEVDGQMVGAQAAGGIGVGFTGMRVPFALHLQTRVTGFGEADVTDNDRDYVQSFEDILVDGQLFFDEIEESEEFDLDPEPPYPVPADGSTPPLPDLEVQMPEERLDSEGEGGYLARVTFGASLATTVTVGGRAVDLGVTPKLSSLVAQSVASSADEAFDDAIDFEERFEDSEVSDTSFTFDVGGAFALERLPLRLAAVLRNVIPESLETEEGLEFETTPQLLVGGVYDRGPVSLNADLALNEAELDGLPTRVAAFGVEYAPGLFALRGGIHHDAAREEAATALTFGFGIGPFDLGARATSVENTVFGAQLSFSF